MIHHQFVRYVAIGLLLNASLYCGYLLLTHMFIGSRLAMTITYSSGVLIGFLLNRKVTFRYSGNNVGALRRYVASYALGYIINFAGLWLLVERVGIAHEIVQGGMTVALPIALFVVQKYWVFPAPAYCPSLQG
jgi:putative flippase GtrA